MTQEQAGELAKILQAYADGKILEYQNTEESYEWIQFNNNENLLSIEDCIVLGLTLRIKPERKRVPLTKQDLIDRELSNKTVSINSGESVYHISNYDYNYIYFQGGNWINYESLKDKHTFLNNDPCYKEVDCE